MVAPEKAEPVSLASLCRRWGCWFSGLVFWSGFLFIAGGTFRRSLRLFDLSLWGGREWDKRMFLGHRARLPFGARGEI